MAVSDYTVLRLSTGLPQYAARGITQTLFPIPAAAQMRRTVNGTLKNVAASQFRKYGSTITCRDMDHPIPDTLWPGDPVTVDCIEELKYEDTTDGAAARTVVSGSTRTADGWVYYRPRLTMLILDFRIDHDEAGAEIGWTLELEEV